jgi:hypothetical protein
LSAWVWTTIPSATGVVQEAGVPRRPSISTTHRRQEPNASTLSVAHSLGTDPGLGAARITLVPSGTVTVDAVDRQVDGHACARRRAHVAVVERYDEILHAAALRSQFPAAMPRQMPKSVTDFGPRSVPERAPGSFKNPAAPAPTPRSPSTDKIP